MSMFASQKAPRENLGNFVLNPYQLQDRYYSVSETAKILGKDSTTVRNWCVEGKLAGVLMDFGSKKTYKIHKANIVAYFEAAKQRQKIKQIGLSPKNPGNHMQLMEVWEKACAQGLINGRPYSPNTLEVNHYFLKRFLQKYGFVSYENLKAELMSIPVKHFGKREKIYKVVWHFSKWLVREGHMDGYILQQLPELLPKRHQPPRRVSLTEEQLDQLEAACKTVYEKTIVILLSHTGLRASEFCCLTRDNVLLKERKLKLIGKGGKYREIGLTKKATETVEAYLKEHPRKGKEVLFLDKNGKPLIRDGLASRLKRIGRRAGIPQVHSHAMRRSFVTVNANKGRSLVTLQILCGHSDIGTTRAYCQTSIDDAVKQIQDWD
jgi:site-specific recombinase XerD